MSTRELFEFVVDPSLAEDQIDEYLEKVPSPLIALVDNDLCCHNKLISEFAQFATW